MHRWYNNWGVKEGRCDKARIGANYRRCFFGSVAFGSSCFRFFFCEARGTVCKHQYRRLAHERARGRALTFLRLSSPGPPTPPFGSLASQIDMSNPANVPGFNVNASRSCCASNGCNGGHGAGSGFETRWSNEEEDKAEAAVLARGCEMRPGRTMECQYTRAHARDGLDEDPGSGTETDRGRLRPCTRTICPSLVSSVSFAGCRCLPEQVRCRRQ